MNNNSFRGNILKLMGGTAAVQIINLLVQPIISRIYDPDNYGVMAVLVSIIAISNVVGFLSYDKAITILDSGEDPFGVAKELLHKITCLFIIVFICLICYLIVRNADNVYLALGVVIVFMTLIDNVFTNLSYKLGMYGKVAKRKIIVVVINVLLQVYFGMHGYTKYGMYIAFLLCTFIGVVFIGYEHISKIWNSSSAGYEFFKKYRRLPLFELPNNLLNVLSIQLPVFVLAHYVSTSMTGQYGLASRIVALPLLLISSSFSNAYAQKFATMYNNKEDVYSFTKNVWKKIFLLGVIPLLCVGIFGQQLFVLIFGRDWYIAGKLAQILMLSSFVSLFSASTFFAFVVINKGFILTIFGVVSCILRCIAMLVMLQNIFCGIFLMVLFEVAMRLIWLYKLKITLKELYI